MRYAWFFLPVFLMIFTGSCSRSGKPSDGQSSPVIPERETIPECKAAYLEAGDRPVLVVNEDTLAFVRVRKGSFYMGTEFDMDNSAFIWETPRHRVELESDYYLCAVPVPQSVWLAVMRENPSAFSLDTRCPVENVSFNDCIRFIDKLNELTGVSFRLPTEAEWEFAANGGSSSRGYTYSGGEDLDDVAWYYNNSHGRTHPVGTKSPNELGLYDMAGNVWNWCSDNFSRYEGNIEPYSSTNKVVKGSGWCSTAKSCRATRRYSYGRNVKSDAIGFRLAI